MRSIAACPIGGAAVPSDDVASPRRNHARVALEARWVTLTRETLPALARERSWPVGADHCFQRILFDNAVSGCWYDHIAGRPAYRHAEDDVLARAFALGEEVAAVAKT